MKKEIINEIEQKMSLILNNEQKKLLNEVLIYAFFNIEIVEKKEKERNTNQFKKQYRLFLALFLYPCKNDWLLLL